MLIVKQNLKKATKAAEIDASCYVVGYVSKAQSMADTNIRPSCKMLHARFTQM